MSKKLLPAEFTMMGVNALAVTRQLAAATTLVDFLHIREGASLRNMLCALGEYTVVADDLMSDIDANPIIATLTDTNYKKAEAALAAANVDRAKAATLLKEATRAAGHAESIAEAADAALKYFSSGISVRKPTK